jgi:hypothetical protein
MRDRQVFHVALGEEEKPVNLYLHKKGYYSSTKEEALKEKLGKGTKKIYCARPLFLRLPQVAVEAFRCLRRQFNGMRHQH